MIWLAVFCIAVLSLTVFLVHLRQPADALAHQRTTTAVYQLPNPDGVPLTGAVHFQARNITFHVMDTAHLNVKSVDALLMPTSERQPVTLDDPESMKVQLLSAATSISADDLTTLLNDYALRQAKLPVHSLQVSFQDGELQMKGKMHKLIDIPFSASANIGATPAGNFHLHFNKITAAGFLHKKVLDLLGLDIDDFAKSSSSFHVVNDDVDFPMHVLFPAPHFSGHLRSATIEGKNLVQVFGVPEPFSPAPVPADHYVYLRGGVLDFGRLSMRGADLELLSKDADSSFELSLRDVFLQALPGYLKARPDHGMVAYIESYRDLPASAKGKNR